MKNLSLLGPEVSNQLMPDKNDFCEEDFWYFPFVSEELALTLNGKRRKIKRSDFEVAMNSCSLEKKIIDNLFSKFTKVAEKWLEFIDISFLPKEMKQQYKLIITRRYQSFFDAQI